MKKKAITLLMLLIAVFSFAQDINNYKYVIVQEKYEFQKKNHEYNVNNLIKSLFEKYGFEVYYANDQLPAEVALDRCKALHADVQKVPGFLSTNVSIALNDCRGNALFTTEVGKSKIKDYKSAYHEAIRDAARSFNYLDYKYKGEAVTQDKETVNSDVPSLVRDASLEVQLFAQPIPNGYQLIDATPKVVLRIYKTSRPDYFTAIYNNNNGVVFKKDDQWLFEYYENDVLISRMLNIKF